MKEEHAFLQTKQQLRISVWFIYNLCIRVSLLQSGTGELSELVRYPLLF